MKKLKTYKQLFEKNTNNRKKQIINGLISVVINSYTDDDLDDACIEIQDEIGQSSGDNAGMFFSEYSTDGEVNNKFSDEPIETRLSKMKNYIDSEGGYCSQDYNYDEYDDVPQDDGDFLKINIINVLLEIYDIIEKNTYKQDIKNFKFKDYEIKYLIDFYDKEKIKFDNFKEKIELNRDLDKFNI